MTGDPQAAWAGLRGQIQAIRDSLPDGLPDGPRSRMARLDRLLETCRKQIAAAPARPPAIRSLHHFACTGGTLIARCLGAQPNVRLLSEIDPLSPQLGPQRFHPTNLGHLARLGTRPAGDDTVIEIFLAGLGALLRDSAREGCDLVLREHAHGKYCHGRQVAPRPGLYDMLTRAFPVRALVTLRHPLDSYLSLERNGWLHFQPGTLEQYAGRMMRFLDDHAGIETLRYEDILADPPARIAAACAALDLPFEDGFMTRIAGIRLSGDSGRAGDEIAARPRRAVAARTRKAAARSATYEALCARLSYNPDPGAAPLI